MKQLTIDQVYKKIYLLHSISTETLTPLGLCRDIVSRIPANWKDPNLKILDPCCGRGTFLLAVIEKLLKAGHPISHIINNMVYGIDVNSMQVKIALKAFLLISGFKGNIINKNSLEYKWNMKFDVVVGNPPFRENDRKDAANKLWPQIVQKTWELLADGGYYGGISPTTWMNPTADIGKGDSGFRLYRDIMQPYETKVINCNSDWLKDKYFPTAASTFSYYIIQKKINNMNNTDIIYSDNKPPLVQNLINYESLPKKITNEAMIIDSKFKEFYIKNGAFNWIDQSQTRKLYPDGYDAYNDNETSIYKYKAYHTAAKGGKFRFSKINPIPNKYKIAISLSGEYAVRKLQPEECWTDMCLVFSCQSEIEADNFMFILDHKLYRYRIMQSKHSGWNPRKAILTLPKLDLSRKWSNDEIFDHFEILGQDFFDHINSVLNIIED